MIKFLIINKKSTLSFILILIISFAIISTTYLFFINDSTYTFSVTSTKNISSVDLNNDGKKDKIDILKEDTNYIINIESNNSNYSLVSKDGSNYLGNCSSNWPIKIDIINLSKDNIPSIIVRSFKSKSPVNYIFKWNGKIFENIFESNDNIFGLLDSKNNRTTQILSLSSREGDSSIKSYMILGNNLKDISFSKIKLLGLSEIQNFINIIEASYELSETPDIFTQNIDTNELSLLWGLDKNSFRYSLQNAYFNDFKWNSNGDPISFNWTLSFESVNKEANTEAIELLLYLTVEYDGYKSFKISSIRK